MRLRALAKINLGLDVLVFPPIFLLFPQMKIIWCIKLQSF